MKNYWYEPIIFETNMAEIVYTLVWVALIFWGGSIFKYAFFICLAVIYFLFETYKALIVVPFDSFIEFLR